MIQNKRNDKTFTLLMDTFNHYYTFILEKKNIFISQENVLLLFLVLEIMIINKIMIKIFMIYGLYY